MRFVTHCPSCGTSFKVVADQLRIAQGWVRCGQCQAVYKAVDTLMPAASDAPQEDAAPTTTTPPPSPDAAQAPSAAVPDALPDVPPAPVQTLHADPATGTAWPGAPDPQEVARQHQSTLARIAAVIAAKKALVAKAAAVPQEPDETPAQAADAPGDVGQEAPVAHTAPAPLPAEADETPPPPPQEDGHITSVQAVHEQAADAPSDVFAAWPPVLPELPAQTSGLVTLLPDGAWQFSPLVEAPAPQPEASTVPLLEPTTPAPPVLSAALGQTATPKRSSRSEAERRARHERRARRAAEKAAALAATALSKEELSQQALEAVAAARSVPSQEQQQTSPDAGADPAVDAGSAAAADLSFVRAAQRRAFWQRPGVRSALLLALAFGVVTLAGQWLFHQRASIYAQVPLARVVLEPLCKTLRCSLPPWKNIDAVGIDSSSFQQLSERVYRLNVSVRNTSIHPVAMPALEVILLNDDEQIVVRRVVANDAALPAPPVLTPRGEWNGSVLLHVRLPPEAGRQSIAGYRVAVFYP